MGYTTEKKVREASGFRNIENISKTTVDSYIGDADSVIDASIGERYSIPLSETPDIIETISRHITIGLLYANEYGEETNDTDKGWKNRVDWAMDQMEKIKTGILKLYGTTGEELTRATLHQPAFYPTNASSEEDATDSTAPKFGKNKTF